MSGREQPNQTSPKTRGSNDDERDEDREQRAAEDDDAEDARAAVEEIEGNTAQSQLDAQETVTDPANDDAGGDTEGGSEGEAGATSTSGGTIAGAGTESSGGTVETTGSESESIESDLDLSPGATGEDSPLNEGATDPRYDQVGATLRSAPVEEPSHDDRIGGWDDFSDSQITQSQDMLNYDVQGGGTQQNMEVLSLSSEADAETAFVTHYGDDGNGNEWEKAHSQMVTFALADAVGLRYPSHTFDESTNRVIVADAVDENEQAGTLWDLSADSEGTPPAEWADRVDPDELVSHYALHMLIGNNDLHGGNIIVSEDGTVHTFDGDKSEATYESTNEMKESMGALGDSIRHLEDNRTEPLNITRDDIVDEAREIALHLQNTQQKEPVLELMAQYDEQFADRSDRSYRDRLETNLDALIFDIPGI